MSFLPENYKIPEEKGNEIFLHPSKIERSIKIAILEKPVIGYEYWVEEGETVKPIRLKEQPKRENIAENARREKDGKVKIKHFWAIVVWNYKEQKVQIMQVVQKSIMNEVVELVKEDSYSNPLDYDIKISKSGEGFDTKYTLIPLPREELQQNILESYSAIKDKIDLEKLFVGEMPF